MIYYIRWLAVIPGAVVCAMLVTFPIHWLIVIVADSEIISAFPADTFEYLAYAFFTPFNLIVSGSYIAPAYKLQTGRTLSVILALMYTYVIFFSDANFLLSGMYFTASVVLCITGILTGLHIVRRYHLQW